MRSGCAALLVLLLVSWTAAMADAPDGQSLYDKKCAMCHGKDGVAKKMAEGSANLNDAAWQKSATIEAIVKVTGEGQGKMKGYTGKLTDAEILAVAEYVKTLGSGAAGSQ